MVKRPSKGARAGQWVVLLAVILVIFLFAHTAADNMAQRHMGFGFGFLGDGANFDIPFHLIDWHEGNPYWRALLVSTLNTLLVAAMGIVAASLLGLLVGVMRLSENWLVRNVALGFIELVRNTPQLVQIAFWYFAVLTSMPAPRQSLHLPGGMLLNIRGLYLPTPHFSSETYWLAIVALILLIVTPVLWRASGNLSKTGRPIGAKALALPAVGLVLLYLSIDHLEVPALRGFNIAGGVQVPPELVALWLGLSIYTAAFIAEIVRSAILSVHKGQREAALSLGLKPGQVLSKVVLPQALRVAVPPLTSQYLNLIKSSSLGAAIAYPELFSIFAGTVLNQTGREIETIAILVAIFLSINLLTSLFMNWYNRRVALVTR